MNASSSSSDNRDPLADDYETIRNRLLDKSADELAHELPGLIERIRTVSIDGDETIHYVIGVSFTTQGTGFDYWIERVFRRQETGNVVTESVKEPITIDHQYITFEYPPDQEFDASALRGILIANVESQFATDDSQQPTESTGHWISRLQSRVSELFS